MTDRRYAVFGHPIGHSQSPRIHRAFGEQFGLAVDYRSIDAAPADFPQAVRDFFADAGHGANVTLPHKAAALALADTASEAAHRACTSNVLTRLEIDRSRLGLYDTYFRGKQTRPQVSPRPRPASANMCRASV